MWRGRPNKSRHDGNGIACVQSTPRAALDFCSANRAENLCYQFGHGHKLLPQFRKIVGLVYSSEQEHPRPKRKLIRSALINGMCDFEVSVRKANAEISAEQDGCTRMRGTVLRKPPRRRSGIIRGRYLSMRVPTVFPASDGQFCRESTLYEWWKKYRRGPERWGNSI